MYMSDGDACLPGVPIHGNREKRYRHVHICICILMSEVESKSQTSNGGTISNRFKVHRR